jgi:glutathione synthase/RimK-type ligase-like ATP-grasp enzyme
MILLWGIQDDAPMGMVMEDLLHAGADFIFLDQHNVFSDDIEYSFNQDSGGQGLIYSNVGRIDLHDMSVAYLRPYNFREFDAAQNKSLDDPLILRGAAFEMQLIACLNASSAVVVNRTDPSSTNNSKPYQLSLIHKTGFKIPETFISNDNLAVKKFLLGNHSSIYKSISGVRSIVSRVENAQLEYLQDVSWCPTLFQKLIPGTNYRVHVIGNKILALRVHSDRLDYRYGNTTMISEDLPTEVAVKCRNLNALLGLHFSGIDLIRTPEDEWYCLEVNPSPAYSYFQHKSGEPISQALCAFLMEQDKMSVISNAQSLRALLFPDL